MANESIPQDIQNAMDAFGDKKTKLTEKINEFNKASKDLVSKKLQVTQPMVDKAKTSHETCRELFEDLKKTKDAIRAFVIVDNEGKYDISAIESDLKKAESNYYEALEQIKEARDKENEPKTRQEKKEAKQEQQFEESLTLDGGDPRYLYVTSATKVGDIDRALSIWKKIQPSNGEERSFVNQNVQKLEAGRRKIINYANSKVGKMSEENKYKLAKLIADKTYKYVSIDAVNRLLPRGEQSYVDENELNGKQGLMWDILEGKTGVDYMTVVKSTLAISGIALLSEIGAFSAIATGFGMLATFNPVIAACAAVLGAATIIKYGRQLFAPEIKKLIARHKTEKQFSTLMDMEGFKDELGSPEKLDEFMNTYGNGAPPKKEDKGDGTGKGDGDGTGKGDNNGTGKGDGDGTGKGDNNGTGKGDGDGTGKGDDNGTGKGEDNGTGKGDDNGTGKGDDNGTGKGDDNGTGKGDDNGTGKGDDNGTGKGDDNGTGKGDDNGTGKGDGDGTGKGDDNGTGKGDDNGTGKGDDDGTGKGDDNGTGKGDGNGTGKGDDDGKGQPIIIDNEAPTWETQFKEIVSEIDANMKKLSEVFEKLKTLSTDIEKVTTKEGAGEIQDKANPILKEYATIKKTIVDLQAQGKSLVNQNVTANKAKKQKKAQAPYLTQLKINSKDLNKLYENINEQQKTLSERITSKIKTAEYDSLKVVFGMKKIGLQDNFIDPINNLTKLMKTQNDAKTIETMIENANKLYADLERICSTLKENKVSTRDLGLQGIKTNLDKAVKKFNEAKANLPKEQTTENEQPGEDNNDNKGDKDDKDNNKVGILSKIAGILKWPIDKIKELLFKEPKAVALTLQEVLETIENSANIIKNSNSNEEILQQAEKYHAYKAALKHYRPEFSKRIEIFFKGFDIESKIRKAAKDAGKEEPKEPTDAKKSENIITMVEAWQNIRSFGGQIHHNPNDPAVESSIKTFNDMVDKFKATYKNEPGFDTYMRKIESLISHIESAKGSKIRTEQPIENENSDKQLPGRNGETPAITDGTDPNAKGEKKGPFAALAEMLKTGVDTVKGWFKKEIQENTDEKALAEKVGKLIDRIKEQSDKIKQAVKEGKTQEDIKDMIEDYEKMREALNEYHPNILNQIDVALGTLGTNRAIKKSAKEPAKNDARQNENEAEAPTQPNEPSELDNFISYVKQSVQTYLGSSSDARAQGTSRSKIQKEFANKVQEILKTHPESKDIIEKLQTYFSEIESYVQTINKSNTQSGVTKSDKVIETGKIQAAKNAGLDKATLEALGIDPNSLEGNDGPGNNG